MPHPVKIEGISAELGVGSELKGHLKLKVSPQVSKQQGQQIFQQVNQNLGKNPNHLPQGQAKGHLPKLKGNQSQPPTNNNGQLQLNPPTNPNQGNNGLHLGQLKHNPKPNTNTQPPTNPPTQNQPQPVNQNSTQTTLLNNVEVQNNVATNQTLTIPNIRLNPNGKPLPNNQPDFTDKPHPHDKLHPSNRPFQNNFINIVVKQVFQTNNIHLSNNDVRRLIDGQNFPNQKTIPPEIKDLVQNISNRATSILENLPNINGKTAHQTAKEIARQFSEQIQTTKNTLWQTADLNAKPFNQTNIQERVKMAIEMMPLHLSTKDAEKLLKHTSHEVLHGFWLTRGLISADEKSADVRNLISFKPSVLPAEMSLTAFRDVGQLVKILIANAAVAKNTAGLDLSVQKFVRILVANNELGVLLAAVKLAAQANSRSDLVSRTIALVQIYELINRLILAGEKAMREAAMQTATKNIRQNVEQEGLNLNQKGIQTETDEINIYNTKLYGTGAESALRQFLEFNPNFAFDNSASALFNPDDSRQAAKDFSTLYQRDIEQWLNSGNHRFVKDYDFEKPIGIVVERNNDEYFTASKLRIILIRDGSVQGWHVLKSILVK